MRVSMFALLGLSAILVQGCGSLASESGSDTDAPPQFAITGEVPCESVRKINFICDMVSPEDLAVIPGESWLITSGARAGGRLHLINVHEKTSALLFPTPDSEQRHDTEAYPDCPGPLDLADFEESRPHGLYLKEGKGDIHTLLVVHHGARESIEVFEVDAQSETPTLAWVGCAVAPEGNGLNSVVALPEGGFATTSGRVGVWEWHADSGWELIPGSEDTAPNGIEVSADGRFVYIAGWAEEKLTRLSRGITPMQKDVIQLGFRPDNLRMALDGSTILASGHTDKNGNSISGVREPTLETSNIAAINPATLDFDLIFVQPAIPGFITATTAIQIGDELWMASYRGDRLAYLPMPD